MNFSAEKWFKPSKLFYKQSKLFAGLSWLKLVLPIWKLKWEMNENIFVIWNKHNRWKKTKLKYTFMTQTLIKIKINWEKIILVFEKLYYT